MCSGTVASGLMISQGFAPLGMANMAVTTIAFGAGGSMAEKFWALGLPGVLAIIVLILIMVVPASAGYLLYCIYSLIAAKAESESPSQQTGESNRE